MVLGLWWQDTGHAVLVLNGMGLGPQERHIFAGVS